jgi:hypothetical protein
MFSVFPRQTGEKESTRPIYGRTAPGIGNFMQTAAATAGTQLLNFFSQ